MTARYNDYEPQVLYRFWCDAELLYIGISNNLIYRLGQHKADKPWFGAVTHISLQHYATRSTVEAAEAKAIREERPRFNKEHNIDRPAPTEPQRKIPASPKERQRLLESIKTPKGGFSKEGLARIGISYPPSKGWRTRYIKYGQTE